MFEDLFYKRCVNKFPACDGSKPMLYRRGDLYQWAKEYFDKGEQYFYAEPIDCNKPYGPLQLCEPRYSYEFKYLLTEDEFNFLKEHITLDEEAIAFIQNL